jgi:osmotically-inducible protein OsmY
MVLKAASPAKAGEQFPDDGGNNMKSDSELRHDVERELEWDPSIDARNIGVMAKNGVVTLTGNVSSYSDKWRAERIAKRVAGVTALANDIEVRLSKERTDADIAESARLTLKLDNRIPVDRVKVIVDHGWITLEGTVDFYYQKSAAESDVRYLTGVRGVTNALAVTPKVSPAEVRMKIEEALKRSAQLDAGRIMVETEGSKVILSGNVRSWAEREEAELAAWAAPGVSQVENRIKVGY